LPENLFMPSSSNEGRVAKGEGSKAMVGGVFDYPFCKFRLLLNRMALQYNI